MRRPIRDLERHPWQRRAVLFSATVLIALILALLLYPLIADYTLIHQLADEDSTARNRAIRHLTARASRYDATRRRLTNALDTDDDLRFYGAASALDDVGEFYRPDQSGDHLDRMAALTMENSDSHRARWLTLHHQCLIDRDNAYQRRLAGAASRDGKPEIRELSAVLAAKLGDDDSLQRLLEDKEPAVRAAAALDAGIAGRTTLTESIAPLLDDEDNNVVASAAWALARLDPETYSAAICRVLKQADDDDTRDRLLLAVGRLDDQPARDALDELWRRARTSATGGPQPPSPMLLLAAAEKQAGAVAPVVRSLLATAAEPDTGTSNIDLLAALAAADRLDLPIRRELRDLIRAVWGPTARRPMILAAQLLGREAGLSQDDPNGPTRAECIKLLQQAAVWYYRHDDPDDQQPPETIRTPLASAAAAVALWKLRAPLAEEFVRNAAAAEYTLPGDYIAWHLASSDHLDEARALGDLMLPAPGAPPELRVFNDNERATGAMLLALAARTADQRDAAVDRIRQRLDGTGFGGEDNPFVQHSYRCALVILGDSEHRENVHTLLGVLEFPQRRVMTALLAANDRRALDWLLWSPHMGPEGALEILITRDVQDVAAAAVPELPWIDPAAPYGVRLWQARILSDTYAIGRAAITMRPLP